jgi:hypothetical protein
VNLQLLNTYLLLLLVGLVGAGLGWLIRNSYKWTGPSHDSRFRQLEHDRDILRTRQTNHENNTDLQYQGLVDSLAAVNSAIKQVAMNLTVVSQLTTKVDHLESRISDGEQERQFFADLGCGFKGCPRWKGAEPEAAGE